MGETAGFGSGYKEYVAGMLAGVATVIVGHPFDTVKVFHSLVLSLLFYWSAIVFCSFVTQSLITCCLETDSFGNIV